MAVIDASVWVARFKVGEKSHEQATKIFRSLALNEEKICIPAIAFTEVAGAVKRTTQDNGDAFAAVYKMKDMDLEVFTDFVKLEPLATEIAVKYSVRGADAYYTRPRH